MSNLIVRNAYEIIRQQRADQRPNIEHLDAQWFPCSGPKPKSLLEISGKSNTGKSLLLQQLVARCVLPTYFGGKYVEVVYIDLAHHFNIKRYMDIGRRLIRDSRERVSHNEDDAVLKKCFDSVKFLECFDANAFELAFDEIENLLWSSANIGLLAIDQLDAFYWWDTQHRRMRMRTHYARLTERLKRICDNHNIVCAYTVHSSYIEAKTTTCGGPPTSPNIDYRMHLQLLRSGKRTLNGNAITITTGGIFGEGRNATQTQTTTM